MATTIGATGSRDVSTALFNKLDTKQKGYIDQADLKQALGADKADDSKVAEVFTKLDSDKNGQVSKSELSSAIEKVGNELKAQQDQSRVNAASGRAGPPAGARPAGGGGGAAPAPKTDSSTDQTKYVAAADTDGDGTVSDAEQAAYDKLLAAQEEKAQQQANAYKNIASADSSTSTSSFNVAA
ncbi:MAG: EF-hand domain-containing protein [Massilia sp.]